MYEDYTRQSLPNKKYREHLGTALCVFNSNNAFIIENILHTNSKEYDWYNLMDLTSGKLSNIINSTISSFASDEIIDMFNKVVEKRNRIIHSFQITDKDTEQRLATKTSKTNIQFIITEEYLLEFIKDNEKLCLLLHDYRDKIKSSNSK